ncbi:MAG: ATP synthase subunit C [Oscillospiraceae bacterium]
MNGLTLFILPMIIVALLMAPLYPVFKGKLSGTSAKHRLVANLCLFVGVFLVCIFVPAGGFITALAEGEAVTSAIVGTTAQGMGFLAAALAVGLGSIGAGIAVAAAAPAAIGAFSEDPKAFGKALIFVALGEGVAIYGLLIAILIINKL